jgi:hypothetical protein
MSSRWLTCVFAATALFSVACDDSTGLSDSEAANVSVVHASALGATATTSVDVLVNGQTFDGGEGIGFGAASACRRVDADSPDLTIQQAGTSTVLATPATFTAGGRNTVVLSGPAASLRVTTISDPLTPPLQSGRARVRVFNGTTRTQAMDVIVTPFNNPAAAVQSSASIGQTGVTEWLEVPAGGVSQVRINNAGTTTQVATISVGLTSGEEMILVAVDPITTGGDLRWVITSPCPAP